MSHLDELNEKYPVRRTAEEKAAFRKHITEYVASKGGQGRTETTKNGKNENVVIGNPLTADIVFTAHYDTPGRSLFPNIMIPRNQVLFYAYQFVPVIVLLALTFLLTIIGGVIGALIMGYVEERLIFVLFLLFYYTIFYLMFFAFKNPKNYNDNTSGVATLLEIFDKLNSTQLQKTAFIFFDNEEKGKKGSKEYFADHKEQMKNKLLINFDCVGNGEHILFIAKKGAENLPVYQALQEVFRSEMGETYKIEFYPMKGSESNSDYKNFPCGVGCMACKKTKGGLLYADKIHTPKDVEVCDENITFISDKIVKYLS